MKPTTSPGRIADFTVVLLPIVAIQAYFLTVSFDRPRWFDIVLAAALVAVLAPLFARQVSFRTLGLTGIDVHRQAILPVGAVTIAGALLLLTMGSAFGLLRMDWDLGPALLTYPLWAAAQLAWVLGIAMPRVTRLVGERRASLVTALLFAAVHLPNPLLTIGGGLMMYCFARIWRRHPALLVFAVGHGVIGALCNKALVVSMRIGMLYFE